jgi:uncharacterized protein RhaS with RHS repeats
VSKDPIGLSGGINLHGYVQNPVHWVDPLGLREYEWTWEKCRAVPIGPVPVPACVAIGAAVEVPGSNVAEQAMNFLKGKWSVKEGSADAYLGFEIGEKGLKGQANGEANSGKTKLAQTIRGTEQAAGTHAVRAFGKAGASVLGFCAEGGGEAGVQTGNGPRTFGNYGANLGLCNSAGSGTVQGGAGYRFKGK